MNGNTRGRCARTMKFSRQKENGVADTERATGLDTSALVMSTNGCCIGEDVADLTMCTLSRILKECRCVYNQNEP